MARTDITNMGLSTVNKSAEPIRAYHWYVVGLLTLVNSMHYLDRQVISIVMEPLKAEFELSDSQLGFLVGTCFAIPFAVAGIPFGILADRYSCRKLLASVLAVWSSLTALCSLAGSYWQLVIVRVFVGAAESPTMPSAVSLISDLFPARRRSTAIGILWTGSSIGTIIAFVIGGYVAINFGWRMALLMAGLPGIAISLLLIFTVKEVARRGADDKVLAHNVKATSITEVFRFILAQRSLVLMYAGAIMIFTVGAGVSSWMASFLIRIHGMTIQEAGVTFGLAHGLTAWIGSVMGGRIADMVANKDVSLVAKVSAASALLTAVFVAGMILTSSVPLMIVLICAYSVVNASAITPVVGLGQSLVGPRMRATALAVFLTLSNLIAVAAGPQIIGSLNDFFSQWFGDGAIRYGILSLVTFDLLAAAAFLLSIGPLKSDLERASRLV